MNLNIVLFKIICFIGVSCTASRLNRLSFLRRTWFASGFNTLVCELLIYGNQALFEAQLCKSNWTASILIAKFIFLSPLRAGAISSRKSKELLGAWPRRRQFPSFLWGHSRFNLYRTASKKTLSIKPTIFNIISNFGVIKSQRRSQFPRVCAGMIQYLITHKPWSCALPPLPAPIWCCCCWEMRVLCIILAGEYKKNVAVTMKWAGETDRLLVISFFIDPFIAHSHTHLH